MYIIPYKKKDTMNEQDINTLIQFANLCLKYLAEDHEYGVTGLWQNLENSRQYLERIKILIPYIDAIISHHNAQL